MLHTAAAGDTWGIPGPAFIVLYLVGTVTSVFLALRLPLLLDRNKGETSVSSSEPPARATDNGRLRDKLWTPHPSDPTAEEMAYLAQRRLALQVALATLLVHGAIRQTDDGHVVATNRLPTAASPLQRAVHTRIEDAGAQGRSLHFKSLLRDDGVTRELDAIGSSLRHRGYLRSRLKAFIRVLTPVAVLLVALVVGLERLTDGTHHHKPVTILLLELLAVLVGLYFCVVFAFSRDFRLLTPRAKDLLQQMRNDYWMSHRVSMIGGKPRSPVGFTRARAPLSVALFGPGALQAIYPEVVTSLHIPLTASGGSGSNSQTMSFSSDGVGGAGGWCGG